MFSYNINGNVVFSDVQALVTALNAPRTNAAAWRAGLESAMTDCFNQTTVTERIRRLYALIKPYVVGTEGETRSYSYLTNGDTQFSQALTDLVNHVSSRHQAVNSYLTTVDITPIIKKGDINNDGQIDSIDYVILQKHLLNTSVLSGDALKSADVDSSGFVDTMDLVLMKKYLMGQVSDF